MTMTPCLLPLLRHHRDQSVLCRWMLLVMVLWIASPLFSADLQPAKPPVTPHPQRFTYRITGLFSPDREADLREVMQDLPNLKLVSVDFDHAEGVFEFDPVIAFHDAKLEELVKRVDDRLRNASESTFGVQPLCTTPREQLKRVVILVLGVDCKACCLAAYESIYKIEGVAQATASFRDRRVTALIDPAKTNEAELIAALKKHTVSFPKPPEATPAQ